MKCLLLLRDHNESSSGRSGTPFSADEQFTAFGRILKTYDGFLDEMTTKLKN
jgi:hypothetical protein